jgi:hypothetical protein
MERIAALLDELRIPYHFTGGLAVFYYGEPRFTQDIDVVLRISSDRPEAMLLLGRLSQAYFVDVPTALEAIRGNGLFQALERSTMIKIDFHVGEKIPGELNRSIVREYAPGLQIRLPSKEDAILSKLIWMRLGSHKAKSDATTMWKRDEELDRQHLSQQALRLGLTKELSEVQEAASPGQLPEDLDISSRLEDQS